MKRIKGNMKLIIGVAIGILISVVTSYTLAATLIKSTDVSYVDNANLGATNVQAAIDGTCTKFSTELQSFLLKVYPVGSIYISYSNTNPGTLFGGTWETFGKGQTLVGIDTSSTEFKTLGQAGGSKTISYTPSGSIGSTGLTISQIPSHSHSYDKADSTTGSHTLTIAEIPSHNHDLIWPDTNYLIELDSGTQEGGAWIGAIGRTSTTRKSLGNIYTKHVGGGQGHTHTISTTSSSTGTAGKGTTSDGHTHTFTGTAATLNNLQPYITVYMWKRTK